MVCINTASVAGWHIPKGVSVYRNVPSHWLDDELTSACECDLVHARLSVLCTETRFMHIPHQATLDWKDSRTGKTHKVVDQTTSDVIYFPHTDTGENHGPSDGGLGCVCFLMRVAHS